MARARGPKGSSDEIRPLPCVGRADDRFSYCRPAGRREVGRSGRSPDPCLPHGLFTVLPRGEYGKNRQRSKSSVLALNWPYRPAYRPMSNDRCCCCRRRRRRISWPSPPPRRHDLALLSLSRFDSDSIPRMPCRCHLMNLAIAAAHRH